ncbi:MAG: cytochrome c oxidase assembly protein [Paracoccaceae bacterium]|nr:cytochrome c oxidase assembly protein [Paracoccaceae bacterium]
MTADGRHRGGGANGRLAIRLAGLVAAMLALSFASVPLYDWFCRVTGFGGETAVVDSERAMDEVEIAERRIRIRFDASLEAGMPWEFRPVERQMELAVGESGLAFYEAHNPTDRLVAGTASYNVYPFVAGGHFVKIECFCFEEQRLEPGETVRMPVSFFVDPEILDDPDASHIRSITLSYTFHTLDLPEAHASLASDGGEAID